ncbi:MAG: hypothetical protein ACOC47_01425 [Alkalispirochaetaceae bacterium]
MLSLPLLMLLLGSLLPSPRTSAQDLYNPYLEPEAPEALFATELGDAEADLFVLGSWTAGWGTSFGIALHPPLPGSKDRVTYPYPYPAFEKRSFYQLVDLTLSLWLYERYFFETTFMDDFEFNSLLLGYQGREDEPVRYVVAGNSTLPISEYAYLNMGDAGENVPGMAAKFGTESTEHEFLLRIESTVPDSTLFHGLNAVDEQRIEPVEYMRGRFFVLPDENVANLTVYLEDREGTVLDKNGDAFRERRYRKIDLDSEAVYSLSDGTLALREPAEGRVLVYYESGGLPVGSAGLGQDALVADDPVSGNLTDGYQDFSFDPPPPAPDDTYFGRPLTEYRVPLSDGRDALLLYAPGRFNPFERLNRYAAEGVTEEDSAELLKRGTSEPAERFDDLVITPGSEGEYITVSVPGADPRDVGSRFPFARPDPESGRLPPETRIYGPRASAVPAASNVQIAVQQLSPVESITVEERTVPGTVTVLRNGVPLSGVSVDYESGEVNLPGTILPGDQIELRYRRYTEDQQYGDLLFASGNRITFSDYLSGELALGGRWNISDTDYSAQQGENPGSVILSSALDYETENLQARVDGALQLYQPDTTGYLRIDGMDTRVQELAVAPERLLPGSVPRPSQLDEEVDGTSEDTGAYDALSGLTRDNRGKLFFKEYTETNAFGAEIVKEYDASIPSEQEYPYEAGSRRGPYTATAAGDGIEGRVAIADFELAPGEWEAMQLSPGGTLDLRNTPEISFHYSLAPAVDGSGPPPELQVWLQIGYISEDSDGDGTLDEGDSGVQPLIPFDDAERGITLFAGDTRATYDRRLTEDTNNNGLLDLGAEEQFISKQLGSSGDQPIDRWRAVTIELTPEERSRLSETTSVRIVLLEGGSATSASPSVGRLLLSKLELYGSGYATESDDPDAGLSVREGPDPLTGSEALRSRYATVREIFLRDGSEQRVLEMTWNDMSEDSYARAFRPTPGVFRDEYGELRFYAYIDELSGATDPSLRLTLSENPPEREAGAPGGAAISAAIDLDESPGSGIADGWSEIAVDSGSGAVTVNGVPAGSAEISGGSLTELRYTTIEVTGADAGTLYIDEVHFAEPQVRLDGATSAHVSWQRPGVILEARGYPLLEDFEVTQRVNLRSRRFSGATTVPVEAGTFVSSTGGGVTVAGVRVEGDATASVTEGETSGEAGHRVTLPAGESPLVFEDTFRRTFRTLLPLLGRSNSLLLSTESVGNHRLASSAELERTRLSQEWTLSSETPSPRFLTLSTDLSLYQNARGYTLCEEDYATAWIGAYPLLLRYEEGIEEERRGRAALSGRLGTESLGLFLEPEAAYNRLPSEEQRNEAALRLTGERIGGAPGAPSWRVAPYYERRFTTEDDGVESGDFGDDLGEFGNQSSQMGYPYTSVPGWELFVPLEETPFSEETGKLQGASYTPEAGLLLERPIGSRITDLYIPSALDFSVNRGYAREEDSLTDKQEWSFGVTAGAINLFGRQGGYPTFDIYQSDEIRNSFNLGILRDLTADEVVQTYAFETKLALYGVEERVFDYRHRFETEIGEEERSFTAESESAYTWTKVPLSVLGMESLTPLIEEGAFYRHTVRASATVELLESWSLDLIFGHETALEIPETGSIRAYIDLGWTNEPFAEGTSRRQQLLGVMFGIEGSLQF